MLEFFVMRQQLLPWLVLLPAVCLLAFFGCSRKLRLRNYRVCSPKVQAAARVVLLSDLHSSCFGKGQHQLLQMVQEAAPDLVLCAGDMLDDRCSNAPALLLLEQLAQKYPCLLVSGNHEFRTGSLPALRRQLAELGVTVLDGHSATAGFLAVHGLADAEELGEDLAPELARLGSRVEPEHFNILLAHRPEYFEQYIPYGFDLVLCGHTHGGQWRLPGLVEGVFASGQGLLPTYAGGCYKQQGCRMIVSRGLSKKPVLIPRIFNRPEVVLVQLLPGD